MLLPVINSTKGEDRNLKFKLKNKPSGCASPYILTPIAVYPYLCCASPHIVISVAVYPYLCNLMV